MEYPDTCLLSYCGFLVFQLQWFLFCIEYPAPNINLCNVFFSQNEAVKYMWNTWCSFQGEQEKVLIWKRKICHGQNGINSYMFKSNVYFRNFHTRKWLERHTQLGRLSTLKIQITFGHYCRNRETRAFKPSCVPKCAVHTLFKILILWNCCIHLP